MVKINRLTLFFFVSLFLYSNSSFAQYGSCGAHLLIGSPKSSVESLCSGYSPSFVVQATPTSWACYRQTETCLICPLGQVYDTVTSSCISSCSISGADANCECPLGKVVNAAGDACILAGDRPFTCPEFHTLIKNGRGQYTCEFADVLPNNGACPADHIQGTAFRGGLSYDYCAAPPDPDQPDPDEINQPEVTNISDSLNTDSTTVETTTTVDNGDGSFTTTTTTSTTSNTTGTQSTQGGGSATASGDCFNPPVCQGDEIQCAQLMQAWLSQCKDDRDGYSGSPEDLYQKESGEYGDRMNAKVNELKSAIESSQVGTAVNNFFSYTPPSAPCPTYTADVGWFSLTFDHWCSDIVPWSLIASVLLAVSTFIALRIAVS